MRAGLLLVGGILGVLIVRYLVLDELEVIGWGMFWSGLGDGDMMDTDTLFNSSTFWKCVAGFVIGGGAGWFAGSRLQRRDEGEEPNEERERE